MSRLVTLREPFLMVLKIQSICGGIIEVAKGLWIKKEIIDVKKLINYAFILDVGVVYRRLGFLLELFEIGEVQTRDLLEKKLTKSYSLLDPSLFKEGAFTSMATKTQCFPR